jgi:multidrug efflux pump subunit AcrB
MLRMRPIFMTTLTTILAMIPMAVSNSGNGALMSGMALVIIGGLFASTILPLLLLPTFYLIFDRNIEKMERKKQKRLEKLAKRQSEAKI